MKRLLILLFFICALPSKSNSQTGWQQMTDFNDVALYKIIFLNDNTGFSVGTYDGSYCMIYKTTNGGINWTSINQPGGFNPCELFSIHFVNSNTGFIVGGCWFGGQPILMKTTNQGNSWVNQTLNIANTYMLWDINFSNTMTGFISGSQGLILKTTNGGTNWDQQNTGTGDAIRKIQIAPENPEIIYAVGVSSFVLKSSNGGLNWQRFNFPVNELITGLSFINSQTGYVSGELNSSPYTSVLYKTENGGINWLNFTTNLPPGNRSPTISFLNENTGYLAASAIYKTTNAGINWNLQESFPWWTIYNNIFCLNQNFIAITCTWQSIYNGIILKTISGGDSPPKPPSSLGATRRLNVNKLIWIDNSMIESGFVIERKMLPDTLWEMVDSVNSNETVFYDTTGTAEVKYRVFAFNEFGNSTYSNEVIPTLTGFNLNNIEIPKEFMLNQNYPNPFNPTTTISFSLPSSEYVSLKVFNALGKEVSVLIEEYLSAGEYQQQWDARAFSSGVYFYRFQAGSFIKTKSLVLLK